MKKAECCGNCRHKKCCSGMGGEEYFPEAYTYYTCKITKKVIQETEVCGRFAEERDV